MISKLACLFGCSAGDRKRAGAIRLIFRPSLIVQHIKCGTMFDAEPLTPAIVMLAILAHAVQVVCQDLAIARCQPIIRNHSLQSSDHFI